jgi:hypothetical protein
MSFANEPGVDTKGLRRLALESGLAGAAPGAWAVEESEFDPGLSADWRMAASDPEGFPVQEVPPFQVVPVQRLVEAKEGHMQIRILKGEGWGTGQHPTTRLCLDFLGMDGVVTTGCRVIDYGSGSGVLSIGGSLTHSVAHNLNHSLCQDLHHGWLGKDIKQQPQTH